MSHADKYLTTLKQAGLGQIRFQPELGGGNHALGVENALGVHILISQFGSLPEDDDENPFGGEWDVAIYGPEGGFIETYIPADVFEQDGNTAPRSPERWVEVIRGAVTYLYFLHATTPADDRGFAMSPKQIVAGHILSSLVTAISMEEDGLEQGSDWNDVMRSEALTLAVAPAFFKTGLGGLGFDWRDVRDLVQRLFEGNPHLSGDEKFEYGFDNFDEGLIDVLVFLSDIPAEKRVGA